MTENAILMASFRCELLLHPRVLYMCAYAVLYLAPCAGIDKERERERDRETVCVGFV